MVKDEQRCKIVLRFTYRNHLNNLTECKEEFVSIHDFRNYLRWMPERAMAIGYIASVEETMKSTRSSNVRLSILNREKEERCFVNVHEFVRFLDEHPPIAKLVQYQTK